MVTKQDVIKGLREVGLSSGDHVMVHSSLKSFGYVEGGPDCIIEAILEIVGIKGTLLVPTNTFNGYVTDFLEKTKEIDLSVAPSLLGIITETVRKRANALRSCHPTHPVAAIGALAEELLGEHHKSDSPAGVLSPYGKLAKLSNGKILLLGVNNSCNTTFHTAEEYYAPYIFSGKTYIVRTKGVDGKVIDVKVKGYCTGVKRNFTAADSYLVKAGFMNTTVIGNAKVTLLNSKGVIDTLKGLLSQNPYFLVHESSLEKVKNNIRSDL